MAGRRYATNKDDDDNGRRKAIRKRRDEIIRERIERQKKIKRKGTGKDDENDGTEGTRATGRR